MSTPSPMPDAATSVSQVLQIGAATSAAPTPPGGPARAEVIDAARMLLASMGISAADLVKAAGIRPPAPTFNQYIPVVTAAVSASTAGVYGTYWRKTAERWGDRPIDQVTPTEIETLTRELQQDALERRNYRGGIGTIEHTISALRCLYTRAVADGLISAEDNPAAKVRKPRRPDSQRSGLPLDRLAELVTATATASSDPELDSLIIRFHIETACRRGGMLALRPRDLDTEHCLAQLHEKGNSARWQPISPTLTHLLQHHIVSRGAAADQSLLRTRTGRPVGRRRYDTLFGHLYKALPWAAAQQVSAHWLRHTTLTWVERHYGYSIALAYAGHKETPSDAGTTARYTKATLEEVATALTGLTAESHPLALSGYHGTRTLSRSG